MDFQPVPRVHYGRGGRTISWSALADLENLA